MIYCYRILEEETLIEWSLTHEGCGPEDDGYFEDVMGESDGRGTGAGCVSGYGRPNGCGVIRELEPKPFFGGLKSDQYDISGFNIIG